MEAYPPGSVVLVPFPFTDLSGRKRRPALVVSPEGYHDEDLILCAITSQLPQTLSEWEIPLEAGDMVEEALPKRSVIKVGKLFTMHRDLIARKFGTVKEQKLQGVLGKLRTLFARSTSGSAGPSDSDREAVESEQTLRRLMHNFSDQQIGQMTQRSAELDIETLPASVSCNLGRQAGQ